MVPPDRTFHSQTWPVNSSRDHLACGGGCGPGQLALHHHLRGDAGMVGAGLPERVVAAHPVPAGQDVLQRVVEGVAHVQAAGDVRRRDEDGEGLGPGLRVGAGAEGLRVVPCLGDAGLGLGRR